MIEKTTHNAHCVRLISITQDLGDDPMSVMMRQIMTLFDEYQSKENAKHTLRAMKENARQGFWNGALPPIGYRIVVAGQRGSKTKKALEIDPIHADTIRLIYRLALQGEGDSGPLGIKSITTYLNERNIRTRGWRAMGRRFRPYDSHARNLRGPSPFQRTRLQDQGAETFSRARHHGGPADRDGGRVQGGPGRAQIPQSAVDGVKGGQWSRPF